MSRYELYSPEGLRADGRRYNELRFVRCAVGTHAHAADGSATVEMGTAQAVCTVSGPQEPRQRGGEGGRAQLTVNVHVAPFSSVVRSQHASNDKQLQELSMSLCETFEEVVLLHLIPRTEIVVDVHVLAQDGHIMPLCINAMCLALIDAGVPMREFVAAVGVALAENVPLLDPNHLESADLPVVTVGVVGKSGRVTTLLAEKRLLLDRLQPCVELGIAGCREVHEILEEQVRERLAELEART